MTVKELIDILDRLDPEAHVFVKGYEGGLDYAGLKGPVTDIVLDVHSEWYYGKHDYASTGYETTNKKIVKGIVL
jgi:hypothetical protein